MSLLEFRLGIPSRKTRGSSRRLKQFKPRRVVLLRPLAGLVVLAASMVALSATFSEFVQRREVNPIQASPALIVAFYTGYLGWSEIGIVRDNSGSMSNFLQDVQMLVKELRSRELIVSSEQPVQGLGVATKYQGNLLSSVKTILRDHSGVKSIYIYSDFKEEGEAWRSDEKGFSELGYLLREKGVKLNIKVMGNQPGGILRRLKVIAFSSGGSILQ